MIKFGNSFTSSFHLTKVDKKQKTIGEESISGSKKKLNS